MLTVGLTGGIASGKSTVAKMLGKRDCEVIEADLLAHEYLDPGNPVSQEVIRAFGPGIVEANGSINRAKLGEIVFGDTAKLARLNAMIHPRVRGEITRRLNALARPGGPAVTVVVAALHIETGYDKSFDRLAVAWCQPKQQIERLMIRGLTREQSQQRIASQLPIDEKRRLADDVIDCSQSLEETRRQVEEVFAQWKQLA